MIEIEEYVLVRHFYFFVISFFCHFDRREKSSLNNKSISAALMKISPIVEMTSDSNASFITINLKPFLQNLSRLHRPNLE
jgi:hypothetical protein